ncbi:MAG: NUDIX hydrolase [Myxococcaceae bacterium]
MLAPLFIENGVPHLIFTKRPLTLRQHAGQISFPGGGRDESDATPLHTALRETEEELGIPPESVDVLGSLDELPTITRFRIRPFVGVVPAGLSLRPNPDEVAEVLKVPLPALLDPSKVRHETREVPFLPGPEVIDYYDLGQHVIWGATARILRNLFEVAAGLTAFEELKPRR